MESITDNLKYFLKRGIQRVINFEKNQWCRMNFIWTLSLMEKINASVNVPLSRWSSREKSCVTRANELLFSFKGDHMGLDTSRENFLHMWDHVQGSQGMCNKGRSFSFLCSAESGSELMMCSWIQITDK